MNLAHVDLNLLVSLDALLSERNVTRAGERVGLSQPAMSNTLRRLRRLFGDELLIREGQEFEFTPLAEQLRAPLSEILQLIDNTIEKRPTFDPSKGLRTFTVLAADHTTILILQPLFERFRDEAPGVRLQIRPLRKVESQHELAELDLVCSVEDLQRGAESQELFRDRWVCVVWSGNKDVGETLTPRQFRRLPHLGYGPSIDGLTGLADRAASALYPDRLVHVSVQTFFLLPFLLEGTSMVAFMIESVARRLAAFCDIRVVEPPFEAPIISEVMFWHPRFNGDPAHAWLRTQIAQQAAIVQNSISALSELSR